MAFIPRKRAVAACSMRIYILSSATPRRDEVVNEPGLNFVGNVKVQNFRSLQIPHPFLPLPGRMMMISRDLAKLIIPAERVDTSSRVKGGKRGRGGRILNATQRFAAVIGRVYFTFTANERDTHRERERERERERGRDSCERERERYSKFRYSDSESDACAHARAIKCIKAENEVFERLL